MENMRLPVPRWRDDEEDAPFIPTPGGLFDGLHNADIGSSLHLLMNPEDIASVDGLDDGQSPGDYGSRPLPQEAPAVQTVGQRSSPEVGREYNPYDQNKAAPDGLAKDPTGNANLGTGDVAGKIWNLPNSAIGLGYGAVGYLAGWPSKWLGLQENAPGVTTGNNAVQFTDSPFGGVGAITLGNVQVINGKPTDHPRNDTTPVGQHEEQHTYQGEQLGPLYLPSNILGGMAGLSIDGSWHGPHNWNEVGPQQHPPVPWLR